MIKKHLSILRSAFFVSLLLSSIAISTVRAIDIDFFQSNDIIFYDPSSKADKCSPKTASKGSSMVTTGSNNNKDYAGNQIISDEHMAKIKEYQPIYEQASKETRIPWQMFAVLHLRESVLAYFNPDNGQGIYQDSTRRFNDYKNYDPNFEMNDSEFLRQTKNAGQEIIEKVEASGHSMDEIERGDEAAIKNAFFYYNGAAGLYVDQAIAVVGPDAPGYEGSPYVMNRADKERDPTVEPTKSNNTWGQVKVDYAQHLSYPANSDHGAYVMYAALAGVPTSGGSVNCTARAMGSSAGKWAVEAMQIYYQIEEPWKSTIVGGFDLGGYGCGPTSTAMAIASLKGDESITPKEMAQFFYDQVSPYDGVTRGFSSVGTSFFVWEPVMAEYDVSITFFGTDISKAEEALKRGSLVIMSANSAPLAPLGGHVLLLRGVTDSGNFLVADPASQDRTNNESGFTEAEVMQSVDYGFWEIKNA